MTPSGRRPVGQVVLRRARASDLPAVLDLLQELDSVQAPWRVFPVREDHRREMKTRYALAIDQPDTLFLVATDEDEVVGMALGQVMTPSTLSDEPAVEISSVVVKPSHRRRGIGRALTAEIARFAGGAGVRRVALKVFAQNEEAVAFWGSLGFVPRMLQMTAPVEELVSGA